MSIVTHNSIVGTEDWIVPAIGLTLNGSWNIQLPTCLRHAVTSPHEAYRAVPITWCNEATTDHHNLVVEAHGVDKGAVSVMLKHFFTLSLCSSMLTSTQYHNLQFHCWYVLCSQSNVRQG